MEIKTINIKGYEIGKGKPVICVPIMGRVKDDILKQAKEYVNAGISMIEWRVDVFEKSEDYEAIKEIVVELGKLLVNNIFVYTYRTRGQGGEGEANTEQLVELHKLAAKSGMVDFVDIEYFASKKPEREIRGIQGDGCHVIASHHDFDETPEAGVIHMLLERMYESGADIVKLAVMPQNIYDVFSLLEQTAHFHENHPNRPVITMSMGKYGSISRVAGEYFGSCVTFGAGEEASAPGQLPYSELDTVLSVLNKCING